MKIKTKKLLDSFKRKDITQAIEEDLQNLNKIEKSLINSKINLEGVFDFEFFAKAKKLGEVWIQEKRIIDHRTLYSEEVDKIMNLFPKTFEYVEKHKLGWQLCGWFG